MQGVALAICGCSKYYTHLVILSLHHSRLLMIKAINHPISAGGVLKFSSRAFQPCHQNLVWARSRLVDPNDKTSVFVIKLKQTACIDTVYLITIAARLFCTIYHVNFLPGYGMITYSHEQC